MIGSMRTSGGVMGVQAKTSQGTSSRQAPVDGRGAIPDLQAIDKLIRSWAACADSLKTPQKNQRFLTVLAVYMVQGFKAEEECLMRVRSPKLATSRIENHRLALLVQTLMVEAERESEMTRQIDLLIAEWQNLQNRKSARSGAERRLEH